MKHAGRFLLTVLFFSTGCGNGIEVIGPAHGTFQSAIVNGQEDSAHPAVGLLEVTSGMGVGTCTTTLIGSKTFLTAAHCVEGSSGTVTLGGATYQVTQMTPHPDYSDAVLTANDVAIVVVSQAVSGVQPMALAQAPPAEGEAITIVGFGITGTGEDNAGTKRVTQNQVSSITSQYFSFGSYSGVSGNTCQGDSGGPTFRQENGQDVQLGVHSTASQPCGYEGNDMRVDVFYSWIASVAGADLGGTPADTTPPLVTISNPPANATVNTSFTVQVMVSDEGSGVAAISLLVDGAAAGTASTSPASFPVNNLAVGAHRLRAEALDKAGNPQAAEIMVTVSAGTVPENPTPENPINPQPTPGAFGSSCVGEADCTSGLCVEDSSEGQKYCTQLCNQLTTCPNGASCLSSGEQYLCVLNTAQGPSLTATGQGDILVGGCTIASSTGTPSVASGLTMMLLLFGVAIWLRSRTRKGQSDLRA